MGPLPFQQPSRSCPSQTPRAILPDDSGGVTRAASGTNDVGEGRGRHARLPGRIAHLEQIARRVKKIELAAGEETVLAVGELFDLHSSFVEEPDRLLPLFRREGEGEV